MKNLFSTLSEAQINSLTQEERNYLFSIDQKLFPDNPSEDVDNAWLKKRLNQLEADRKENEKYATELERSFC